MAQLLCPNVVGRDAEPHAIESALRRVLHGHGGCVILTGEAGIGKSRLASELASRAREQGIAVVVGRAVAGTNAPYRPLAEALLQLLRDRPMPEGGELARWLPVLGGLIPGLPGITAPCRPART